MRVRFVIVASASLLLAAAPVVASPFVLYENNFATRASVGPVGGETTFAYALGDLVPTQRDVVGQDLWIRRNTGSAPVTVADYASPANQHVQIGATSNTFAYALQPIGSQVVEGVLRLSVDMLSPTGWNWSTARNSLVFLGDDDFYAGQLAAAGDMAFYNQVATTFGFRGETNSDVRFTARDGDGTGGVDVVYGTAPVHPQTWYRFVADVDVVANTYSIDIYDLGTSHPTSMTPTPAVPVETFSDLGFRRNMGDEAVDLNGVTTVGIASFGNASDVKYDNIVIAKHALSSHAHQVLTTEPAIYWRHEDPVSSTTAADAAPPVPYNGSYVGGYTLESAGPRPSDGLTGMDLGNLAVGVAANGAVRYSDLADPDGANIPTGAYSFQMWFNSTVDDWSDRAVQHVFGRSDGTGGNDRRDGLYLRGHVSDTSEHGKLVFYDGGDTVISTAEPLDPGQWYHLAFVRDDSAVADKVRVYLNGQLEILSGTTWQGNGGNVLAAGHRTDLHTGHGGLGLYGLFDEVAVWDRPLSTFDVQANYLSALPRDESDYSQAVLASGPEAYWRLNEGPEWVVAMDSSGNAHHFEYHASVQRGAGELGPRPSTHHLGFEQDNRAPRLTGGPLGPADDGYLGIVDGVLPGQNDYTAALWFRPDVDTNAWSDYLFHRGGGAGNQGDFLGLRSSGAGSEYTNVFFYDGNSSEDGATALTTDQWYHLAVVREGDDVLVYLDGGLEISTTMAATSTSGQWAFGGRSDRTGQQKFTGSLDEITIFGRALSHEEIRAHYLVGVPEPSAVLLLALGGVSLALRRRRRNKWRAPLECCDSSPLSVDGSARNLGCANIMPAKKRE